MSDSTAGSEEIKDLKNREFAIDRVFDAPRTLVFKAWSEPERLAKWWGPRGWTTTNYRLEFRPGGVWHYCMRGPNGMESWGLATYREIVEPERIIYVDMFSDETGKPAPGAPEMLITVEFEEIAGNKTRLISKALFPTVADLEATLKMGMIKGLTETWDRLEEYLATA